MAGTVEPIEEDVVRRIAAIVGPASAAQRALDDAAARRAVGEEVIFLVAGNAIVVARLPYPAPEPSRG